MEFTILEATPAHEEAVYGLICLLEGEAPDRHAFHSVYSANVSDASVCYFVALGAGRVVGFASLHMQRLLHHAGLVGEIQEIVVEDSLRSLGIGRALFTRIRETSSLLGCVQLEVCCRKTRDGSRAFYQRMGMSLSHDKLCLILGGKNEL